MWNFHFSFLSFITVIGGCVVLGGVVGGLVVTMSTPLQSKDSTDRHPSSDIPSIIMVPRRGAASVATPTISSRLNVTSEEVGD